MFFLQITLKLCKQDLGNRCLNHYKKIFCSYFFAKLSPANCTQTWTSREHHLQVTLYLLAFHPCSPLNASLCLTTLEARCGVPGRGLRSLTPGKFFSGVNLHHLGLLIRHKGPWDWVLRATKWMTYSHHAFLDIKDSWKKWCFSLAKIDFLQTMILEEMNFVQFMLQA